MLSPAIRIESLLANLPLFREIPPEEIARLEAPYQWRPHPGWN